MQMRGLSCRKCGGRWERRKPAPQRETIEAFEQFNPFNLNDLNDFNYYFRPQGFLPEKVTTLFDEQPNQG